MPNPTNPDKNQPVPPVKPAVPPVKTAPVQQPVKTAPLPPAKTASSDKITQIFPDVDSD